MASTILYLENVTVDFDGFKAIQKLNSYIKYGELRFLIGPNGAGKTTLLDVVCGKTKPAEGRVIFGNTEITRKKEHEIVRMGICRKFQNPYVFSNLTVFENLELAVQKNRGIWGSLFHKLTAEQEEKIYTTLENISLVDKAWVKASSLSHGQKQWLEIGMQLVQDPQLLLLDEPVAGLSRKETERTGLLLREIAKNRSVLVVEHDMEFVKNFAQRVTVMHEGRIICEGSVDKVHNDPQVIEVYLGRGRENVTH